MQTNNEQLRGLNGSESDLILMFQLFQKAFNCVLQQLFSLLTCVAYSFCLESYTLISDKLVCINLDRIMTCEEGALHVIYVETSPVSLDLSRVCPLTLCEHKQFSLN